MYINIDIKYKIICIMIIYIIDKIHVIYIKYIYIYNIMQWYLSIFSYNFTENKLK